MHDSTDRQTQSGTIGVGIAANVTSDSRSPSVHSDMMRLGNEDPRYDVSNDPNEFILRQGTSIVTVNTIFKAGSL